jgi:hypothetical protein
LYWDIPFLAVPSGNKIFLEPNAGIEVNLHQFQQNTSYIGTSRRPIANIWTTNINGSEYRPYVAKSSLLIWDEALWIGRVLDVSESKHKIQFGTLPRDSGLSFTHSSLSLYASVGGQGTIEFGHDSSDYGTKPYISIKTNQQKTVNGYNISGNAEVNIGNEHGSGASSCSFGRLSVGGKLGYVTVGEGKNDNYGQSVSCYGKGSSGKSGSSGIAVMSVGNGGYGFSGMGGVGSGELVIGTGGYGDVAGSGIGELVIGKGGYSRSGSGGNGIGKIVVGSAGGSTNDQYGSSEGHILVGCNGSGGTAAVEINAVNGSGEIKVNGNPILEYLQHIENQLSAMNPNYQKFNLSAES